MKWLENIFRKKPPLDPADDPNVSGVFVRPQSPSSPADVRQAVAPTTETRQPPKPRRLNTEVAFTPTLEAEQEPHIVKAQTILYGKLHTDKYGPIQKGYEHNIVGTTGLGEDNFERSFHPFNLDKGVAKDLLAMDSYDPMIRDMSLDYESPWDSSGGGMLKMTLEYKGKPTNACSVVW